MKRYVDVESAARAYAEGAKVVTCGHNQLAGPCVTIEMPDGSQAFLGLMDLARLFVAKSETRDTEANQQEYYRRGWKDAEEHYSEYAGEPLGLPGGGHSPALTMGECANLVSAAGDAGNNQETGERHAQIYSEGTLGSPTLPDCEVMEAYEHGFADGICSSGNGLDEDLPSVQVLESGKTRTKEQPEEHPSPWFTDPKEAIAYLKTEQPDDWRPPCPDIEPIRKLAREVGYAIGEHGSKIRDYDLIAAPWTDDAVAYNVLIEHLCKGLNANLIDGPTGKPLGRRSCCIQIRDRYLKHIDLSIMPRGHERESVWQPIETAPKDGSRVLLKFKDDLSQYDGTGDKAVCRWDGIPFVGRNSGDVFEWRFAAPVGQGGIPDAWLLGWMPIPGEQRRRGPDNGTEEQKGGD